MQYESTLAICLASTAVTVLVPSMDIRYFLCRNFQETQKPTVFLLNRQTARNRDTLRVGDRGLSSKYSQAHMLIISVTIFVKREFRFMHTEENHGTLTTEARYCEILIVFFIE